MTPATKLILAVAAAIVTLAITHFWREFPLRLALISGVAVGVLVFATLQTSARLGNIYRRR